MGEVLFRALHQQFLGLDHPPSTVRDCNSDEDDSVSFHPHATCAGRVSATIANQPYPEQQVQHERTSEEVEKAQRGVIYQ
jgi:hypothetical protein